MVLVLRIRGNLRILRQGRSDQVFADTAQIVQDVRPRVTQLLEERALLWNQLRSELHNELLPCLNFTVRRRNDVVKAAIQNYLHAAIHLCFRDIV